MVPGQVQIHTQTSVLLGSSACEQLERDTHTQARERAASWAVLTLGTMVPSEEEGGTPIGSVGILSSYVFIFKTNVLRWYL